MKKPSLEELAKKANEWAASPEGQKAIEEALRFADETSEALRKATIVSSEDMKRPLSAAVQTAAFFLAFCLILR